MPNVGVAKHYLPSLQYYINYNTKVIDLLQCFLLLWIESSWILSTTIWPKVINCFMNGLSWRVQICNLILFYLHLPWRHWMPCENLYQLLLNYQIYTKLYYSSLAAYLSYLLRLVTNPMKMEWLVFYNPLAYSTNNIYILLPGGISPVNIYYFLQYYNSVVRVP